MAKPRYTMEQHKALGRELYEMRERLTHLIVDLSAAYPMTCRGYKNLCKAEHWLDMARSALDDELFREHGEQPTLELLRVYYPGGEHPQ